MAIFNTAGSTRALDMSNLPYFDGRSSTTSSNKITVSSVFQEQEYYGAFEFALNGSVSGELTATYYSSSTIYYQQIYGLNYSITDFSVDAAAAFSLIGNRQVLQLESIILAGDDTVTGTNYSDTLLGFSGNDRFFGGGSDTIDGGSGTDTAIYAGMRSRYDIAKTLSGVTIRDTTSPNVVDSLISVERVLFDDVALAFDADGHAGQIYRLFHAAFGRDPRPVGMGFWTKALDNGVSLESVASSFCTSPEFSSRYGVNVSNADFINLAFMNVLHRAPRQAGFDWYLNELDSGRTTQVQVLVGMSESAEHQANVVGVIQSGIEYIPYT